MTVSQQQIKQWKDRYGNIYAVELRAEEFIFRELTFSELDQLLLRNDLGTAELEEELVRAALLSPVEYDFDKAPAGIISSIAEQVLGYSGITDPKYAKEVLVSERDKAQNTRTMMKAFVLAVVPNTTEDQLDQLTFRELVKQVILAEEIIKVNDLIYGIQREQHLMFDLIDPEEEAEKEQAAREKFAAQRKPGQAPPDDPIARQLMQALE